MHIHSAVEIRLYSLPLVKLKQNKVTVTHFLTVPLTRSLQQFQIQRCRLPRQRGTYESINKNMSLVLSKDSHIFCCILSSSWYCFFCLGLNLTPSLFHAHTRVPRAHFPPSHYQPSLAPLQVSVNPHPHYFTRVNAITSRSMLCLHWPQLTLTLTPPGLHPFLRLTLWQRALRSTHTGVQHHIRLRFKFSFI